MQLQSIGIDNREGKPVYQCVKILPRRSPGEYWIYYVPFKGYCKVGQTMNLRGRMKQYKFGLDTNIVYFFGPVSNPLPIERQLIGLFGENFISYQGAEYFKGGKTETLDIFSKFCDEIVTDSFTI